MNTLQINRTGAAYWGSLPFISPDMARVERVDYPGTRSGMSQRFTRSLPGYKPFAWLTGSCGSGCGCAPCGSNRRMRTRGEWSQIEIPRQIEQGVSEGIAEVTAPRTASFGEIALVAAGVYFALNLLGGR